jgi:type IV pilus assembly protein PilE
MRRKLQGVTLVELLTVVVIVGILASIALPSYRSYLLRSQRTDATTALLRVQSAEEKYLVQNGKYTKELALTGEAGLGLYTQSEQGFYDLNVVLTATGYSATATPAAGKGQASDTKCQVFSVNEVGKRSATDTGGVDRTAECWR